MEQATRCAVVTGGNRGIGFEICRQLASNGIYVVLCARDELKGNKAVQVIKESGYTNVICHQLDLKNPTSIASLANFVQTRFGKLDILVNNAAVIGILINPEAVKAMGNFYSVVSCDNPEEAKTLWNESYDLAEECLETNYFGTKRLTEALLHLLELSNSTRIVNLTSKWGLLNVIRNEEVKAQLRDVISLKEEDLDVILQRFLKDFKEDKVERNGWPVLISACKMGNVATNTYTRILARRFPNILTNCVTPGYVSTDLTFYTGYLTAEEGARAPVKLALLPDEGTSGSFFDQMDIYPSIE